MRGRGTEQDPRGSGDRAKTDRRDTGHLVRLLLAGKLHPVRVPGPEEETLRDLVRAGGGSDGSDAQPAPALRHTVASRALLAGESIDEVAFLLGHRDANVTRAVYLRELSDSRCRTMRRSRMVAEFADVLGGANAD